MLYKLIKEYKYGPVRGLSVVLAELLYGVLPEISGEVTVVPLPTIKRHIRERGFDHMKLLAKNLAKQRNYQFNPLLVRRNDTVQVGASEKERCRQAQSAYGVKRNLDKETTYLLVDDVWTTGASMEAATEVMRLAGAKKIIRAVVAISGKD